MWLTLLGSALTAQPLLAAVEVAVSVSPAEGVVGRPIEVLVRTFTPIAAGDVSIPAPSLSYPAPSGLWNVLYPIPDYPFDVVAQTNGASVAIALTRDPDDASLWRGTFTPTSAGEWRIVLRNFPTVEPPRVQVAGDEATPTALAVGVGALLAGLIIGVLVGRGIRRPRVMG